MGKKPQQSDGMSHAIGTAKTAAAAPKAAAPETDPLAGVVPHLAYTDLREWMAEAAKLGELREVSGASWQEDIGQATEMLSHEESAPCVVFKDIPGTLPGSRVLVNFFGGQRQKMTLGFPTHLNKLELSEAFRVHYMAELKRIPPKFVNDGGMRSSSPRHSASTTWPS